jgi:nicotinate-nucleotide adenylyltransferase
MIGVFGGTFDPPHHGHLILADTARDALNLERVLWAVTGDPPHKPDQPISPLPARLAMVRAAINADPFFEISRVDISRPAPHYSHETMRLLRRGRPDAQFAFLIGSDSLRDLPKWDKPALLVERVDLLGVMRRPGVDLDLEKLGRTIPGVRGKVTFFEAPFVGISGHEIRRRVRQGEAYRYLVPGSVARIIDAEGLYV